MSSLRVIKNFFQALSFVTCFSILILPSVSIGADYSYLLKNRDVSVNEKKLDVQKNKKEMNYQFNLSSNPQIIEKKSHKIIDGFDKYRVELLKDPKDRSIRVSEGFIEDYAVFLEKKLSTFRINTNGNLSSKTICDQETRTPAGGYIGKREEKLRCVTYTKEFCNNFKSTVSSTSYYDDETGKNTYFNKKDINKCKKVISAIGHSLLGFSEKLKRNKKYTALASNESKFLSKFGISISKSFENVLVYNTFQTAGNETGTGILDDSAYNALKGSSSLFFVKETLDRCEGMERYFENNKTSVFEKTKRKSMTQPK